MTKINRTEKAAKDLTEYVRAFWLRSLVIFLAGVGAFHIGTVFIETFKNAPTPARDVQTEEISPVERGGE